jgi:hypothetical protein
MGLLRRSQAALPTTSSLTWATIPRTAGWATSGGWDLISLSAANLCVWNKSNAGMGSFYRSKHEPVCFQERDCSACKLVRAWRNWALTKQCVGLSRRQQHRAQPDGRACDASDRQADAVGLFQVSLEPSHGRGDAGDPWDLRDPRDRASVGKEVRQSVLRSDPPACACSRRQWHMDEVVVSIAGEQHWLGVPSIRMASFSMSWSSVEETVALCGSS